MSGLFHGTNSFLIGYGLATSGVIVGLKPRGPLSRRIPASLLIALPALIGSLLVSAILFAFFDTPTSLPGIFFANVVGMGLIVAGGFVAAKIALLKYPGDRHKRGTRVLEETNPRGRAARQVGSISLAGQTISSEDETKHFKLIGTTGTGKSTAISQLLADALERGDRAIIADPDGGYTQRFYKPQRGDVILNSFDNRSARWDLFGEILAPHDADKLARALIPDYEGSDRNWRGYARTFLTAILRQMHRAQERDLAKLYFLLFLAEADELRELLDGTPAATFLGRDNGRFFDSVRSVAATHLAAIEHVAAQQTGELLSVRDWVVSGKGVMFIPYRAGEISALRQLISSWMRTAIFQTMDLSEPGPKMWFVVDELDALGPIDGLKDALARLRKFGGRCVLGFQSIAQVRGTYGDAEAQTIVENCSTTLILRCSASERGGTAEFASRLIGKREVIRRQVTETNAGFSFLGGRESSTSTSDHHTLEDAVLASEIEQLPDMTGFLKVASRPEWMQVHI